MLRVDLPDAEPGMILALPVRNPNDHNKVLLRIGYALNTETITRCQDLGVKSAWIRCPSLEVLCKFFNEDIINAQSQMTCQIAQVFTQLQGQVTTRLPYHAYRKSIGEMIQHLVMNPEAALFLENLSDSTSRSLVARSSRMAYLSLLMGLKLEGYLVRQRRRINSVIAKEVTSLGLGAMLHDVGITQLPEEVYNEYDATGDESDPQWREHPTLGYEMLRGKIEPSAATIVLNHHQRYDGSGYAGSSVPTLDRERIHVFARIAGLADQFERMVNPSNLPPQPVVAVLGQLLREALSNQFDPHVIRALISVVPPYPPGSAVRLSDGRCGICIDHTPVDPCRPVVQVVPDIDRIDPGETLPDESIDLFEEDPSLYIIQCDGHDVGNLNFPSPDIMRDLSKGLILKRRGRVGLL